MSTDLVFYNAARTALQQAAQIDEVKDIRDKAAAMKAYAKQAKDRNLIVWSTEIVARAERRAGQILADMKALGERAGQGRRSKIMLRDDTLIALTLPDLGITQVQSSRWQKKAAIPEEKFEADLEARKEKAAAILDNVATVALLHTGDEESYTPQEFIQSALATMGSIDLDPASNPQAQLTVKATRFFTVEDDGLTKAWSGNVWMNPPYTARVINRFIDKLLHHLESGEVMQAVVLTNNNTDTSWFHAAAAMCNAICFTRGRINFLKTDGTRSSPTNGQSFFYFGSNLDAFVREFSRHGLVMVRA